jgi:hypothetical protein
MNVKRNQIFVVKNCYHLLPYGLHLSCAQSGLDIGGMD